MVYPSGGARGGAGGCDWQLVLSTCLNYYGPALGDTKEVFGDNASVIAH